MHNGIKEAFARLRQKEKQLSKYDICHIDGEPRTSRLRPCNKLRLPDGKIPLLALSGQFEATD